MPGDVQPTTPTPPVRHAVCGYVIKGAGPWGNTRVAALCGEPTPLRLVGAGEKCGTCAMMAEGHAAACSCFKTWPGTARLPRPENPGPRGYERVVPVSGGPRQYVAIVTCAECGGTFAPTYEDGQPIKVPPHIADGDPRHCPGSGAVPRVAMGGEVVDP